MGLRGGKLPDHGASCVPARSRPSQPLEAPSRPLCAHVLPRRPIRPATVMRRLHAGSTAPRAAGCLGTRALRLLLGQLPLYLARLCACILGSIGLGTVDSTRHLLNSWISWRSWWIAAARLPGERGWAGPARTWASWHALACAVDETVPNQLLLLGTATGSVLRVRQSCICPCSKQRTRSQVKATFGDSSICGQPQRRCMPLGQATKILPQSWGQCTGQQGVPVAAAGRLRGISRAGAKELQSRGQPWGSSPGRQAGWSQGTCPVCPRPLNQFQAPWSHHAPAAAGEGPGWRASGVPLPAASVAHRSGGLS